MQKLLPQNTETTNPTKTQTTEITDRLPTEAGGIIDSAPETTVAVRTDSTGTTGIPSTQNKYSAHLRPDVKDEQKQPKDSDKSSSDTESPSSGDSKPSSAS